MTMRERETIMQAIRMERIRQDHKWGTSFIGRGDEGWLTILAEEFGEVAEAVLRDSDEDVEKELIQVAAVVVSWLEYRTPRRDQYHEVQREVSQPE